MEKKFTLPAWLVLTIVSIVAAVLLAYTNINTRDIIKARAEEAVQESMKELIPDAGFFEDMNLEENSVLDRISLAKSGEDTIGYVSQITKAGYGGPIEVLVAVDKDSKLLGISVGGSEFKETAGLGSHVKEPEFRQQFVGLSAPLKFERGLFGKGKNEPGEVDGLSGATVSSLAVFNAVDVALNEMAKLLK